MNKPCLILGIGGSGTNILNIFVKSQKNIENIIPLAIDTDSYNLSKLDDRLVKINLTENEMLDHVYQRVKPYIDEKWFSDFEYKENANLLKILKTNNGAHSWRQQGFLSFIDYLLNEEKIEVLNNYIDLFVSKIEDNNYEIYLLSSTNGGTGSGIFLGLSLYIKKYIKEKHDLDIRIKMMLVCPDVYENSQNYDERKKSYANAYAALKELNAINLVTGGFNVLDDNTQHETIDFKITIKDLVLFDSKDKLFWNKEVFPFDKVYLFERIPTIMSISTHEQIIASSLNLILKNKEDEGFKDIENIYAGISISKVQYPSENIIDYLLHRYLLDEISGEWLYAFTNFERKKKFIDNSEKSNNQSRIDAFISFFDVLTNSKNEQNDLDLNFLNRYNEEFHNIKYELKNEKNFIKNNKELFMDFVDSYHNNLDSNKIDELLKEEFIIEKAKMFDSKKAKEARKTKLVERVRLIADEYKKFIIDTINTYLYGDKTEFNNYINDLINTLITDDEGEYVHPIIAMYRLVNFYDIIVDRFVNKKVIRRINDISEEKMKNIQIEDLPLSIFELKKSLEYGTNTYLKAGEYVLMDIIDNGDVSKLKDLSADYYYIVEDFKNFVADIKKDISEFYFKDVLKTFEEVINKYIEFFEKLKYSVEDLEYEVKELKNFNTHDTLCLKNIGSSVKEKEELYSELIKSIKVKKDNDSIIGKIIFDFINNSNLEEVNRANINKVQKTYLSVIYEQMHDNEVIQKVRNSNVFNVLLKNENIDKIKVLRNTFAGILNYNFRPLNLNVVQGEKFIKPTNKNNIFISQDMNEYICKNSDQFNLKSLDEEEMVNEFFHKLGNYNNSIKCSNLVTNKEFLITYEIANLNLSWLKNIDEETSDSYYYKEFYNSLYNKINTDSILWNPSLYKVDNYDIYLPTINLEKQVEIDINNIKALVYEFINKKLICSDVSSDIQNVYFHQTYLDFEPLKYYDEYIKDGEINKLIKVFRNNSVFNTETSEKFDHYIDELCYGLPYNDGFNNVALEYIVEAIYKSSFIKVIQQKFLSNMDLDNKESLIYVDVIIKMMIQIFKKMLNSRLANVKIDDDLVILEIKELIVKIFIESYEENDEYIKIINKNFKK